MSVVLVRHTSPAVGSGICYGRSDYDVAESFTDELPAVLARLEPFDVLVTSPLIRCRRLADEIGSAFGAAPRVDERLQEMDFGAWEGVAWSDIPVAELDEWADDFFHARPHGGESVAMLQQRALTALSEYRASARRHTVVTHAGVIRVALAPDQRPESFNHSIEFGGVVSLDS